MSLLCKDKGQDQEEYLSNRYPGQALHMVLPYKPLTQGWLDSCPGWAGFMGQEDGD